jgi:Domain of unknown function (DUF222)/HNH endonuclease
MSTDSELIAIANDVRGLRLDTMASHDVEEALPLLLTLRNLVDHLAATAAGGLVQLGLAARQGRTPREVLIALGCAPSVAARLIRIGVAMASLPTLTAHAADGAISAEHVDAIVKGITHIAARSAEPVDEDARFGQVTDLLGQFFSGATPAEIDDRARRLGNRVAGAQGGLPAAEDRTINTVDHTLSNDGRLQVRADLDAEVGAKFVAAIEELSAPRPEPGGTPDMRPASRRRADALETVLDIAARGGDAASAPRTQLLLTVPADTPALTDLEYMGPISLTTLDRLSCDATVTTVIVDAERVPVDIGHDKRLFPAHLRKALYLRDKGCIKCGAPAGRTHAHHITHWAHGGPTNLGNGCLLCPACHADVHHNGWDITIGIDKHPWLIPPATVDPHRQPIPAHNRRTMQLDTAA